MNYPLAVVCYRTGKASETFIENHVNRILPGRTAVVTVASSGIERPFWEANGPVLSFSTPGRKFLDRACAHFAPRLGFDGKEYRLWEFKRFLRKRGVRAVLGEYLNISLPWMRAAREVGVPFYAHSHGYDISQCLNDPVLKRNYLEYNDSPGIVTVSEYGKRRLMEIGIAEDRIHVIPCGTPVGTPPYREAGERVRCLAVGRMVAKKGPLFLVDAFRRAFSENPMLHLEWIGGGNLLPAVRQYLEIFGMEKNVTLHGDQPNCNVREMMRRADLFVQHSIRDPETGDEEGLPVSVLEAMAEALPVVATRHAGIPEAVIEGKTGYLVEERDVGAMGERIAALSRDFEKRAGMGRNGYERVCALFSWEREKRGLLELLGV